MKGLTRLEAKLKRFDKWCPPPKDKPKAIALPEWANPLPGPQAQYYNSKADICIYGGAAGGGKTFGTLIDFAKPEFLSNPGYGGVIFRRTCPQITNEGGLWDESEAIYPLLGGEPTLSRLEWTFPSGSTIRFAHLQHEKNKLDWQGSQLPRLGWDEITHFSEGQFFYLLGRSRTTIGIKPQVRATCNPDPDSWLIKGPNGWGTGFIGWWIGDDGYPIPERSGIIRWFIRKTGQLHWADSIVELCNRFPGSNPKSVTFIPSKVTDNTVLMTKDPDYIANLEALHPVEQDRLLGGNWKARHEAGKFIDRSWIKIVDSVPQSSEVVRAWDLAATARQSKGDDPDWTVGIKMLRHDGIYYIVDAVRKQENPGEVQRAIENTASQDGSSVPIGFPQDPGQAGKDQIHNKKRDLAGYSVRGMSTRGDKLVRAKPFAVECSAGNVRMLRNKDWNEQVLSCLHSVPDGAHDDDLDACADAYRMLNNDVRRPYRQPTTSKAHTRTAASARAVFG